MLIMQMFLRDIHDTIRPLSFGGEKSRSWFCWILYGSQRRLENSFSNVKNIDEQYGKGV
jgi:hypothetical protein